MLKGYFSVHQHTQCRAFAGRRHGVCKDGPRSNSTQIQEGTLRAFTTRLPGLSAVAITLDAFVQVFEEPQKKQMLYWVIAIVTVLFVLYNLVKYSRR